MTPRNPPEASQDISNRQGQFPLMKAGKPAKQGLYDPVNEKDACGVGFVAHIKGKASHRIVEDALTMLENMDHRGACGCETNTGDGAGILIALPDAFLRKAAKRDAGLTLPPAGKYGTGVVFLPQDAEQAAHCQKTIERIVVEQGQVVIGWRDVPQATDGADVGLTARGRRAADEDALYRGVEWRWRGSARTPSLSDPQARQPRAAQQRALAGAPVLRL
jgi:glutamate synthase domain-containing protein 1